VVSTAVASVFVDIVVVGVVVVIVVVVEGVTKSLTVDDIIDIGIPVTVDIADGVVVDMAAVSVCSALTVVGDAVLVEILEAVDVLVIKDDIKSLMTLASVTEFSD